MKSMIYMKDNGIRIFNTCETCNISFINGTDVYDAAIPVFYSKKQAIDAGWRMTKDIRFCPPDKDFAWVCPECWPGDAK